MGSLFSFCFSSDCFLFSCFTRKKDIPALKIHIYPADLFTDPKVDTMYSEDICPL